MQAALYIVGAIFELLGIVLLAAPDLVPGAIRFAGWIRGQRCRLPNAVRRLLRRPRHVVIQAATAGGVAVGGHASAVTSTSATTLEEKVEYLLRRDQDSQKMFDDLAGRVAEMESASVRSLNALRAELEAHVADKLTAAQADFKTARVGGTIALAIGLALTTLGNFA